MDRWCGDGVGAVGATLGGLSLSKSAVRSGGSSVCQPYVCNHHRLDPLVDKLIYIKLKLKLKVRRLLDIGKALGLPIVDGWTHAFVQTKIPMAIANNNYYQFHKPPNYLIINNT